MKTRLSKFLVRSHYVLLFAGISAFGYCAIVWSTAGLYQARARELLLRSNAHLATASLPPGRMPNLPNVALRADRRFAVLGRVDVPRIQLSAMIAEGADSRALRVAVGHVPGTALPWQSGNVALVAHRDTFFRRIGELKIGDFIRLKVPGHEYTYQVKFTAIVNPTETWVLQPATGDTLTLATCYPFNFIGRAPKRFIVRARRLDLVPLVPTASIESGGHSLCMPRLPLEPTDDESWLGNSPNH